MTAKNVLVLSSLYNYVNMSQMIEYLASYKKYSKHKYFYHNQIYDFDPKILDFDQFDVIMLTHNFWPMNLSEVQKEALAKTKAFKVMFLQDEYQYVRNINDFMDDVKIDLMFTCVAEKDFDVFYPKSRIKSLKGVYDVLTGYVSDHMRDPAMFQLDNKVFDVGFRSRVSPFYLGTIGHEKFRIADKFGAFADKAGLSTNISVKEEDRLAGKHWLSFLQSCRTQLGTPSGSSIVDFDGRLLKEVASYRRAFPEATFEDVFDDILKRYDGKHVIDTISPRTFESAAVGSTLVQLEGYYGGHIEPHIHYIEIKADYSNMGDVVEQIKDEKLCHKIAKRTHKDLIMNDNFHIRAHVEKFDAALAKHMAKIKRQAPGINENEFYQTVISKHHQSFKVTSDGYEYLDTLPAKILRMRERENKALREKTFISTMLERTGGEPRKKVRKGKVALSIAKHIPAYRSLLMGSILHRKIAPEDVLKDILFLAILKSAQSGYSASGSNFGLSLSADETNINIKGKKDKRFRRLEDAAPDMVKPADDIKKSLKAGAGIKVDLAEVFPLDAFASAILFGWPIAGESELFRSAPDLKFHVGSLKKLASHHPKLVAKAISYTLTPWEKSEEVFLKSVFENPE